MNMGELLNVRPFLILQPFQLTRQHGALQFRCCRKSSTLLEHILFQLTCHFCTFNTKKQMQSMEMAHNQVPMKTGHSRLRVYVSPLFHDSIDNIPIAIGR